MNTRTVQLVCIMPFPTWFGNEYAIFSPHLQNVTFSCIDWMKIYAYSESSRTHLHFTRNHFMIEVDLVACIVFRFFSSSFFSLKSIESLQKLLLHLNFMQHLFTFLCHFILCVLLLVFCFSSPVFSMLNQVHPRSRLFICWCSARAF